MTPNQHDPADEADETPTVKEPGLWRDNGWTARVIKNMEDDGWAVEMILDGEEEPALVGPWTMGRDKKNPKPLNAAAFNTLVKTASEVLRRHEQHLHAQFHKRITVSTEDGAIEVRLDIVPDEYEPYATLGAYDEFGEELAQQRVEASFKFNRATASAWVEGGFQKPR